MVRSRLLGDKNGLSKRLATSSRLPIHVTNVIARGLLGLVAGAGVGAVAEQLLSHFGIVIRVVAEYRGWLTFALAGAGMMIGMFGRHPPEWPLIACDMLDEPKERPEVVKNERVDGERQDNNREA